MDDAQPVGFGPGGKFAVLTIENGRGELVLGNYQHLPVYYAGGGLWGGRLVYTGMKRV